MLPEVPRIFPASDVPRKGRVVVRGVVAPLLAATCRFCLLAYLRVGSPQTVQNGWVTNKSSEECVV